MARFFRPIGVAVVTVLLLAACGNHPPTRGARPATSTASLPTGQARFARLDMTDLQFGWGLSESSRVLRTSDGAATWRDVTPGGLPKVIARVSGTLGPLVLTAAGGQHAWVLAMPPYEVANREAPVLYRTSDGGAKWQGTALRTKGVVGAQIDFLNARTGFLLLYLGGGLGSEKVALLQTADEGATWKTVTPGNPDSPLYGGDKTGLAFLNQRVGFIAGEEHSNAILLYATRDGGRTWRLKSLPIPPGLTAAGGSAQSFPPMFFGPNDGILPVVFHQPGAPTVFYVTRDGGVTWSPTSGVPGDADNNPAVWTFATASDGFATDGGVLYRTTDAGLHWSPVQPNQRLAGTTQLDFLSPTDGWAVEAGRLLHTTDAGKTWSP